MRNFLEFKRFCSLIDLVPTKSKGQNFLNNEKILDNIIKAAEIKLTDIILEIGPGLGNLTEKLAQKAKKVVAIELDKKLAAFLKEKFADQPEVQIIQADILKIKSGSLNLESGEYKLVANLPYNITGLFLRRFLSQEPKPKSIVLMLQKEVVERILEKNKKSAIISVITNFYGQPKIIQLVSKNNFWPMPKIDSAILKIELFPRNKFNLNSQEEDNFIKVVKTGFSHPRKQVASNLSMFWSKESIVSALEQIGLSAKIRAEDIKIANWYTIYRYLYED